MLQGLANAWWKTLDESGTRALCAIVSTTINKQSNAIRGLRDNSFIHTTAGRDTLTQRIHVVGVVDETVSAAKQLLCAYVHSVNVMHL